MRQLALALAATPEPTFGSYFSAGNSAAVAALRHALLGNEHFIYVWGGEGSGKTHLLRAAVCATDAAGEPTSASKDGARYVRPEEAATVLPASPGRLTLVAVDDVERLDEPGQMAVFDLYNTFRAGGGTLLSAGACAPQELSLRNDLRTRLGAGLVLRISPLTDTEKAAALLEHARRRGLPADAALVEYLLHHGPRDMGSLVAILDTLDRVSMERKRGATLPLLRELLRELQAGTELPHERAPGPSLTRAADRHSGPDE